MLSFVFSLVVAGTTAGVAASPSRRGVEADWKRQDERRLAQIREPGLVRFAGTQVQWPGARPDRRLRLPACSPPLLDGRLDEGCWSEAARIPRGGGDQPTYLLCHDGERLYVGVSFPRSLEARFGEHFTSRDAAGAVDGVKNGRYGFHTGLERNPWWQVDLGESLEIARIVVYNRLDYAPGLHNADRLVALTSDDGESWTLRHDNEGVHFGGATAGKPLEIHFRARPPLRARFVRLQVRQETPVFFHLDEVEIYGEGEPSRNVALERPARQSSLSPWSTGGQGGCALFGAGSTKVGLRPGSPEVTIDGVAAPPARAGVLRGGERTCVEVALPLSQGQGRFPAAFFPSQGAPVPIAPGSAWRLSWRELSRLGFGRNRIAVELRAAGRLRPPLDVAIECVVFTASRPRREVLFERTLDRPVATELEFQVGCEGPAAIIASERQGDIVFREGRTFFVEPVRETIERVARLFAESGAPPPGELETLRSRAGALADREKAGGAEPAARSALYREARWLARRAAFGNPLLDFGGLVFVKRFTQETYPDVCLNHMPWVSRPGGGIFVLEASRRGESLFSALKRQSESSGGEPGVAVRDVLRGALGPGHVHGMDLRWDAERVVFGYAKAKSAEPPPEWLDRRSSYRLRRTEEPTHLFEIGVDGSGLRQVTDGEWSDLDPTYLPGGDIAFASERCGYSLQCNEFDKDETSCNLYSVRPDGSGIRRLSVTKDGDYLPRALDDGTIGYTRWEYQERSWAHIQSIWTVRPDGTGEDAVFKQHLNDPWALEDVRPVPGSPQILAIATGHHTLSTGPLVLVDPRVGLNNPAGIRIVTPGVSSPEGGMCGVPVPEGGVQGSGGFYTTPWALSEKHFLASYTFGKQTDPAGYAIYLIDVYGTKELVYRDPAISCFIPIPLRPRTRPPILPDSTDWGTGYATCAVSDISRGVDGIQPERIRYLRISQRIAWPYDNERGGQRYEPDVKSVMINWTPVRVIGTVPVEADGSAHFRVPADIPLYFQLLDERQMELRRMRSFVSFQPGEVRACAGCHETRARAPAPSAFPLALRGKPSVPVPPPWGDRPLSFLRDVQPVFDRRCVRCHGGLKPAAELDFSAGLTERHNRAYDTILERRLVSRSNVGDDAKVTPPLAFGSHKSRLISALGDDRHREAAKLDEDDWLRLVTWIDANAPYHDGFINKRSEKKPYDLAADAAVTRAIAAVHERRCASCHGVADVSRADWIDIHDPERSLFLKAPLAKAAGGAGSCRAGAQAGEKGEHVYRNRADTDYRAVLRAVEAAVENAWSRPRRDLRALKRGLRLGLAPASMPDRELR